MMKDKAYIITGPTASGKSGFAHSLAKKINGYIINCDSVQIYSGIENISASPFADCIQCLKQNEIDGVPYKLFSVLSLNEQISVVDYLKMARSEYEKAKQSNKIPIFVGGTGYYVNALINGISPMPDVSESNRKHAREIVKQNLEYAKSLLPKSFKATDGQRVARALEVFFETGQHISEYQNCPRIGAVVPDAIKVLINPPLDVLHERIKIRIAEMISGGAYDEAHSIIKNNWNPSRAIGATQLVEFLRGNITQESCIENWIIKTNQYAKRQRTWFRGQFKPDFEINRIPTNEDIEKIISPCFLGM